MSAIAADRPRHNVSIKNCLSRHRRNGRESGTRFNSSNRPDGMSQIIADAGKKCFHISAT